MQRWSRIKKERYEAEPYERTEESAHLTDLTDLTAQEESDDFP
jgi:hypothetical protein